MGMFDEIKYNEKIYQTKNFDCLMELYRIENGRLQREVYTCEKTPRSEKPYPEATSDNWEYYAGVRRKVHMGWEDMNYHGVVTATCDEPRDTLFKFVNGNLIAVSKELEKWRQGNECNANLQKE